MLEIVIYGGNEQNNTIQVELIRSVLANYNIDYKLYHFSGLDSELINIINNSYIRKIYIVNINDDKFIQILSSIRKKDPYSIIILITNSGKYHYDILNNKLMVLDFIIGNNYISQLKDDLNYAVSLLYRQCIFTFKYNHVIYAISYDKITYIEKEPSVKRCIIHTLDGNYYIVSSLDKILLSLPLGFYRTHQSCIVNVNNIKSINLTENIIIFNNGDMTSLLSNRVKKDINKYIVIG